ncbi:MAG: hypothetical protein AB9891_04745 [Anaerolineaceae bacterium]
MSVEIQSTLHEYRRILAPGGLLIVTDIYIREIGGPGRDGLFEMPPAAWPASCPNP